MSSVHIAFAGLVTKSLVAVLYIRGLCAQAGRKTRVFCPPSFWHLQFDPCQMIVGVPGLDCQSAEAVTCQPQVQL